MFLIDFCLEKIFKVLLKNSLTYLNECSSTNDAILNVPITEDVLSAVFTLNQNQGRGQYGNTWFCEPNLNLAYSLLVSKRLINTSESLFNFHTAIILREFLANLTQAKVHIKWPNDIIIKDKKVSGMLIERKNIKGNDFYIIGIGINILQTQFNNLPKAGSLLTQTQRSFNPETLAQNLHQYVVSQFSEEFSEKEILPLYNYHLFKKNKISVFELKGLRQNGIIKHADENGFLHIDLEQDGLKLFSYKEIELLY